MVKIEQSPSELSAEVRRAVDLFPILLVPFVAGLFWLVFVLSITSVSHVENMQDFLFFYWCGVWHNAAQT